MSILINGMEMPKNCGNCPLRRSNENRAWCYRTGEYIDFNKEFDGRKNNCPLIEVPPHGRLIDADAHIIEIRKQCCEDCSRRKGIKNGKMKFLYEIGGVVCRACEIEDMLNALDDAQAVIEEEE